MVPLVGTGTLTGDPWEDLDGIIAQMLEITPKGRKVFDSSPQVQVPYICELNVRG